MHGKERQIHVGRKMRELNIKGRQGKKIGILRTAKKRKTSFMTSLNDLGVNKKFETEKR